MQLRLISIFAVTLLLWAQRLLGATEIPFQFRDGMIWVKVLAAGENEPLNFLLDSGAGTSVLDLSTARRLGLNLGSRQNVQTVHNRATAYRVEGFNARVANVAIPSSVLAIDLSGPSRACRQRIDGLVGANFFRAHIVQIDFRSGIIRLLERNEVKVDGCEIIPLTARNDVWCALVSINGNAREWLRLDTGCNTSIEWVINGDKAKKLALTTVGLAGRSKNEIHTDVQIGAIHIPSVKTGLHTEQMFAAEAGLIGNGLLSRFVVTIDSAKRRCLLSIH